MRAVRRSAGRFGRALAATFLVVGTAGATAPRDQYEPFDRNTLVIVDKQTRLGWARTVERNAGFNLANGCDARSELGPGRRYPSVKELLTLVDETPHNTYENAQIVSKSIDPDAFDGANFPTSIDAKYWTSTPAGPGQVWVVDFATGDVTAQPTGAGSFAHLRCVVAK